MTNEPVAKSIELTEQDRENRTLALELIKNSNKVIVSFAKQMVTISLGAVGAILALAKFRGFEDHLATWGRLALALTCCGCLASAVVFAFVLRARRIRVSLDDYADAPSELLTAAHQREVLTIWGLALLVAAIVGAAILLIFL